MLDVSVVVPTHNRRALLLRTVGTVLAQRGVDLELLVVDDGSTDGSARAVSDLGDPRVEVVRHELPRGVCAARNAGLARARAPWVAFLDDDDLWAPDKLRLQLTAAEEPGTGWVCAGAVTVDPDLRIVGAQPVPSPESLRQLPVLNVIPGGGSGTMARTQLVRTLGGFDHELSNLADWDLWVRLSLVAPLAAVPHPLTAYLRHPSSLSKDLRSIRREFEHVQAKFALERAARGLASSHRPVEWFAHRQVQLGRRSVAVRAYVQLWRCFPSARAARWAAMALVSPERLQRRRDGELRRGLSEDWAEEAEQWLAPMREALPNRAVEQPDGVVG
jgi:glycosyltransferase involved in cell wall biosynthesis